MSIAEEATRLAAACVDRFEYDRASLLLQVAHVESLPHDEDCDPHLAHIVAIAASRTMNYTSGGIPK